MSHHPENTAPATVTVLLQRSIDGLFCEDECSLHDCQTPSRSTLYRAYMFLIEKSLRPDAPDDFVVYPTASHAQRSVQPPVVLDRTDVESLLRAIAAEIYAPGTIKPVVFSPSALLLGYGHVSMGDVVDGGLWHRFWEIHFTRVETTRTERPLGLYLKPTLVKE
jgi:hypothetical protein